MLGMDIVPPAAYRRNLSINGSHFSEGAILFKVPDTHPLRRVSSKFWDSEVSYKKIDKEFIDHVFINKTGSKLSRIMIFKIIKKLTKQSGISKNVSPHTLRHSFATHLVEGGADLRAVQEMLGHESITTTEIYTHLDKNYLKQTILDHHPIEKTKMGW